MNVLIAVKGAEGEQFFRNAAALGALDRADRILLVHVIDLGTRGDLEFGRERYLGRRRLSSDRDGELQRLEEERARAGLDFGQEALRTAGVPAHLLEELILRGRPNEALRALAEQESFDLIVVAARGGKPGPHSLGKTARFLVDHAPKGVLLIH